MVKSKWDAKELIGSDSDDSRQEYTSYLISNAGHNCSKITLTKQIKITGRPKKLLKEQRAQIGGNQLQFSDNVTTIKPNTEIERRQPKVNKVNTELERRQPKVNKFNTEQASNTDFKGARIQRDHKAVQS